MAKKLITKTVSIILFFTFLIGTIITAACNPDSDNPSDPGENSTVVDTPQGPVSVLPAKTVTSDRPEESQYSVLAPVEGESNSFTYETAGVTAVGYDTKVIGTVERVKPVEQTLTYEDYFPLRVDVGTGLRYPKYGSTMSSVTGNDPDGSKSASRQALINESSYLTATGTANAGGGQYTWMDENGFLYSGTRANSAPACYPDATTQRQLFKHAASVGLYMGDVSDDDPRIIKQVTMRNRGYVGYSVTGVYAPAGEVIKIQLSNADMNATGGIVVYIGQALYNGQANNIWAAKGQMQRIPHLLNTMSVNKNTAVYDEATDTWTAYVGSFIGGPIYIKNNNATFTATISGGVAYRHFILGYTTKEEFEESSKSTVPYFDLEVWDRGVLHSGPLNYAKSFSYDDLYKVAVLWDKVASVTTTGSNQGIVFLYDPFVAAGAAVAFPGRRSVNCPMSWMPSSLNYNAIVTSGSWGNFHEYHHNFQGYGVGNGGEVTNNGMTLVSYALFTKISSKRGISSFGAQGLGGWNNYTSATWALEEALKIARPDENPSNGNQGLALYATLLHNFGADSYIKAKVAGGGQSYAAYMNAWQNVTHNNMYYYFNDILKGTGISNNADSSYSMFVPVSCVYQTGRSYMYDGKKKYFKTMQPYVIPYGESFDIDLSRYTAEGGMYSSGSIVMPEGFTYKIKSVTKPEHGTINVSDGYHITYTPDKNMKSGQIIVTLQITKNDGAFKVDDVDLVLEFEQSHETNKMTLERTTYYYDSEVYTDAREAYNNGFKGSSSSDTRAHTNPTQNCNTDIWYYVDNEANREKYPDAPDNYFVKENSIDVLSGKLYFEEEGKYRIYLRGRQNCALYISLDGGKTYSLGTFINDTQTSANFRNDKFVDVELDGESWVYFKEVLVNKKLSNSMASFIGLGVGTWTEPLYRMVDKFYDAEGNEVSSIDDENYDHTVTFYYDNEGNAVDAEVVAAAQKVPPASASYVNAYKSNYEFPDNSEFVADYFYIRNYNFNYSATKEYSTWENGAKLIGTDITPWDSGTAVENIFKKGQDNYLHSKTKVGNGVYLTMDMGDTITANNITFLGRTDRPANTAQQGIPKEFSLEISLDGITYTEVGTFTNSKGATHSATVSLGKEITFRYIKINVKSTHSNNGYIILSGINFTHVWTLSGNGANQLAPANENIVYTGEWNAVHNLSCFGYDYVGQNGSSIKFNMIGTRLAILTPNGSVNNFKVFIDGKQVSSIDVAASENAFAITYLSEKLESGTHSVEIVCTGEAHFDSFAIYNEE